MENYVLIKIECIRATKSSPTENRKQFGLSYGHLNSTIGTINNSKVFQGQLIGYSGKTGTTAANIDDWRTHLHLTVYKGNTDRYSRVNPIPYITTKFDLNGNKIK
ncbi:MAG: hypothetical protein HC830_08720 [Bacteroidetes bacterium]|nr:hypothetical protein [Bacteroidota bacterium]